MALLNALFEGATVIDMTTNSEPPEAEASHAESDLVAERLAYSVDEAARLIGLSRDLLYDQMRCGNLPFVKSRQAAAHHPAAPAAVPGRGAPAMTMNY